MGWLQRFKEYLERIQEEQQQRGGGVGARLRPKVKLKVRVYRVATNTWEVIKEA